MGRSVSTHRYAVATAYLSLNFGSDDIDYEKIPEDQQPDYTDFEDFLLDLRQVLDGSAGAPGGKGYPSLSECDRWQDREDHVILENSRGEVSVSEYCGLVAICLAPRDPDNALDQGWCGQVSQGFVNLIHGAYPSKALISQGRMSNGEGVFTRPGKTLKDSCVTSGEGALWGEKGALFS